MNSISFTAFFIHVICAASRNAGILRCILRTVRSAVVIPAIFWRGSWDCNRIAFMGNIGIIVSGRTIQLGSWGEGYLYKDWRWNRYKRGVDVGNGSAVDAASS